MWSGRSALERRLGRKEGLGGKADVKVAGWRKAHFRIATVHLFCEVFQVDTDQRHDTVFKNSSLNCEVAHAELGIHLVFPTAVALISLHTKILFHT